MRKKVKLYVEGTNDIVFLKNYLEVVLNYKIDDEGKQDTFENELIQGTLISTKGWSKINTSYFQKEFATNHRLGIKTLVIIDADKPLNDGGYEKRQRQVEKVQGIVSFDCFLMPNAQDDGYLETILETIVLDKYKPALVCLRDQDACLRQVNQGLDTPLKLSPEKGADKAKLGYFRKIAENKGANAFKDATIWNLHDSYLIPLKTFLENHLTV